MNHKKIYKLLITGGLAPVPLEVTGDYMTVEEGFFTIGELDSDGDEDTVLGYYPFANTIINGIEDNPSYVEPETEEPEPEGPNHWDVAGVENPFRQDIANLDIADLIAEMNRIRG